MSNFDVSGLCKRGEVVPSGHNVDALGRVGIFQNLTSLASRVLVPRDPRNVWMMFVKNGETSAALLPGQLVAWKTALAGTTVVNPAATLGVQIVGVVDHCLPAAGCAAGSYCLITVLGPTKFLLDNNATSAEFDNLINSAGVAGTVRTGSISAGGYVGRNEASGTTAAGTGATLALATSFWGFFGGGGSVGVGP